MRRRVYVLPWPVCSDYISPAGTCVKFNFYKVQLQQSSTTNEEAAVQMRQAGCRGGLSWPLCCGCGWVGCGVTHESVGDITRS
jgi:predicted RNA methylase